MRDNLGLLLVGYSKAEAEILYSELSKLNIKISYKLVSNIQEIRVVLYECEWRVMLCNHTEISCNYMEVLEIWRQMGRDIPFIIYSDEISDKNAITAIQRGVHDYVHKGQVEKLALVIERELKNVEIRRTKLQAESKIYRLTYYDNLTGFPKRNLFCEEVAQILSEQCGSKLAAVYFIKISRLPFINSTYGYHVGDMLIQQLSYRMSVYTSGRCLLTRIGGSKFAFFKSDVNSLEDIQKFADRILRIASTPIMVNSLEFYTKFDVGVSIYPTHANSIVMLLANAEKTLSEIQEKPLSCCRYFMSESGQLSNKQNFTIEALRQAITNNEFMMFYQPIINLKTGGIVGVEALLQWNHPEFGYINFSDFFSLAYENGLILDIGKWMIKQACLQATLWHETSGHELYVSVAISAIEVDQKFFIKYIQSVLSETNLSPSLLALEIPECSLQDVGSNIENLEELSGLGVKFSISNYEKNSSSIKYTKKLPINNLKLDKALMSNLDKNSDNLIIVNAINAMAKELGLRVIAEGIDTEAQLKFLYETQCSYAQGNYFSEPVNAEGFIKLLEQRKTGTLA